MNILTYSFDHKETHKRTLTFTNRKKNSKKGRTYVNRKQKLR